MQSNPTLPTRRNLCHNRLSKRFFLNSLKRSLNFVSKHHKYTYKIIVFSLKISPLLNNNHYFINTSFQFKMASVGSATPEQIDTLLNFLDEHRDLARGRLRSVEGRVQTKRLWGELCNLLNSMGGCRKTVQQWQKVWFDRKYLAKKAATCSRRSPSTTGGVPIPLSQWELKVISILGIGSGKHQTGARVPPITNKQILSTSSQASRAPSFPQPLSVDLSEEDVEYAEPSQDSQPRQHTGRPSVSQDPLASRCSSQPIRRRQSVAGSDVRSRLFKFEEERAERETVRNTELAGIKAALLQLCDLMRGFIESRD